MPKKAPTLHQPFDAVMFDCDSTLTRLEGIDYLAELNGVGLEVKALTTQAMAETGLTPALYLERMQLVRPTKNQLDTLGQAYITEMTLDAKATIDILQQCSKAVFLISAGLHPAVQALGRYLNIPDEHIFAVGITFHPDGSYADFDHQSPLTTSDGKRQIIAKLKQQYPRIVHIGDGLNDLAIKDTVSRFVGFGGVCYREKIEAASDYYITSPSIKAILPLVLTPTELPDDYLNKKEGFVGSSKMLK